MKQGPGKCFVLHGAFSPVWPGSAPHPHVGLDPLLLFFLFALIFLNFDSIPNGRRRVSLCSSHSHQKRGKHIPSWLQLLFFSWPPACHWIPASCSQVHWPPGCFFFFLLHKYLVSCRSCVGHLFLPPFGFGVHGDNLAPCFVVNIVHGLWFCSLVALHVFIWGFGEIDKCYCCHHRFLESTLLFCTYVHVHERWGALNLIHIFLLYFAKHSAVRSMLCIPLVYSF